MNPSEIPPQEADAQLESLLANTGKPRIRWRSPFLLVPLVPIPLFFVYWTLTSLLHQPAPRYRTETARIGTLTVKVSATGNLQPTNQVDVGSELSGIIEMVYVDDNDQVKKGQLLARLDVSKLQDAVAKSRANLAAAEAQVLQADASASEARANLERYKKVSELSGGKVPSAFEMDAANAALQRAESNLASERAGVAQAKAALRSDETNLAKASIRSPIDGVVLLRQVDPGQTVAASFQAPVLFSLAENLAKMELQVDIDEADVGQVHEGQKATFGVDAWPGRLYDAVITRVGYGSQTKDGVVSYPGVLEVDNSDLSLRPGMTGTASITTLIRENALLIPNAALRFTPAVEKNNTNNTPKDVTRFLTMRPPPAPSKRSSPTAAPNAAGMQRIWILRSGEATPIYVKTGASDGQFTEILDGELKVDMEVITESVSAKP